MAQATFEHMKFMLSLPDIKSIAILFNVNANIELGVLSTVITASYKKSAILNDYRNENFIKQISNVTTFR